MALGYLSATSLKALKEGVILSRNLSKAEFEAFSGIFEATPSFIHFPKN